MRLLLAILLTLATVFPTVLPPALFSLLLASAEDSTATSSPIEEEEDDAPSKPYATVAVHGQSPSREVRFVVRADRVADHGPARNVVATGSFRAHVRAERTLPLRL